MSTFDDFMIDQKVKDSSELDRLRAALADITKHRDELRQERDTALVQADALRKELTQIKTDWPREYEKQHEAVCDERDAQRQRVAELEQALRGLFALVESNDLVRNTAHDAHGLKFAMQGVRIVSALAKAQQLLGAAQPAPAAPTP